MTDRWSGYRQNRDPRDAYRQHMYRCRSGCVRAARRYREVGARLREGYEVALGGPAPVRRSEGAVA
ncbi:hypothetical protein [Streptomyces sp. NPDC002644]